VGHITDAASLRRFVHEGASTLRATRPAGEPVTLIETLDERDEADFK
jgi:hypothetical protein